MVVLSEFLRGSPLAKPKGGLFLRNWIPSAPAGVSFPAAIAPPLDKPPSPFRFAFVRVEDPFSLCSGMNLSPIGGPHFSLGRFFL